MDKKQDKYELKVDSKYSKYMKLLIAALTALGLIGTGAHQAGFFDIETEPTSVVCAHDNHDNVEVGNVQVDLNLKGEK
jgi:hypothetical protein